ncbi:protein KRI1 homolog [Haliotis rubra]|uniref:protein KRI1 homolog n=1 Tax=Haliotis rubra TaxID=36100 RepID=UPI001EE5A6A7|nr:protein KRI1 homolog [Haliotis rubra]
MVVNFRFCTSMFDGSSSDEDGEFQINKEYADRYNKWRKAEELQRLKDKYGDVEGSDSDSDSESEDEDGEALTANLEKGWLKTLSALKNKDPKIYQKDVKFYSSDEEGSSGKEKKKKDKPLYLKDYERKLILEKQGDSSSDDSDSGVGDPDQTPGYYKQQEQLRKSIAEAVVESSDSDEDLLTHRVKTQDEEKDEEKEYLAWLKGQKKTLKSHQAVKEELEPLRKYWNDPKLDEGEKFLKDFILNKRYVDKDAERIPTYDEIVDDSEDISDEEYIEMQEKFERKYNFRFEEPGADDIKSFPRRIDDSVRRKDNKRADQRVAKKSRKKEEKDTRLDELKQLKKMKRQEIEQKIEHLREITGNKDIGFSSADLEGDFDPEEHDRMMQQYFADEYYGDGDEEEVKPPCPMEDDDLQTDNWDYWAGEEENKDELYADDPGFVMDADYDPSQDTRSEKKKKKKKSKLAQALSKEKPVFNPDDKSFEQYVDEYYKLDYEDMIGDIPCRFKYRTVMANDFGLNVNEILTCRDKELNSWVSVKKMSQYRSEGEEKRDLSVYRHRATTKKKTNILTSLQDSVKKEPDSPKPSTSSTAGSAHATSQSRKKKKGGSGQVFVKGEVDSVSDTAKEEDCADVPALGKKKKKKGGSGQVFVKHDVDSVSDTAKEEDCADVPAHGKKKKKGANGQVVAKSEADSIGSINMGKGVDRVDGPSDKKMKKKKKRKRTEEVTSSQHDNDSAETHSPKKSKKAKLDNGVLDTKGMSTQDGKKDCEQSPKKPKNKKGKKKNFGMSDDRLKAYGIDPKKIRFMKTDNFKKEKQQ